MKVLSTLTLLPCQMPVDCTYLQGLQSRFERVNNIQVHSKDVLFFNTFPTKTNTYGFYSNARQFYLSREGRGGGGVSSGVKG